MSKWKGDNKKKKKNWKGSFFYANKVTKTDAKSDRFFRTISATITLLLHLRRWILQVKALLKFNKEFLCFLRIIFFTSARLFYLKVKMNFLKSTLNWCDFLKDVLYWDKMHSSFSLIAFLKGFDFFTLKVFWLIKLNKSMRMI